MSTVPPQFLSHDTAHEPTWEIAELYPRQGEWSEEDYLSLPGNRLIELADGRVEVLPMPTVFHQMIVAYLYRALHEFVSSRGLGLVLFSALPIRLQPGKFREPDVLFMSSNNRGRIHEQYWEGADLVMEVVSPNDPNRDLKTKRLEYAQAGIPEYWIVEPEPRRICVLQLRGAEYHVHAEYELGERAASVLLPGFEVELEQVFAEPGF